ncbi:MAG: D-glucuronyl C5-epimerase family protein [Melioribacteraceae bacterium]|nr:D-glucuronyl C5-epimerase family protein [Melioribacteraceae bacterium]
MWRLAEPDQNPNPTDENGIEVFHINGETHYHSLHLIQRMQWYLDSYYQTRDSYYLDWILKYYDKLMELSIETEDYLYFPYTFDFLLHGYENEVMKAPWLSGMTQGVGLMIFTRLYKFTEDETYLEETHKIFNTFYMTPDKNDPWITMLDPDNYFWIEEYPDHSEPNYTLNGFIFCIYGLYEYYQLTRNEDALFILKAAITTVEQYIKDFRVPGDVSLYCLTHRVPSPKYHLIHIKQLRSLHLFTGEQYFADMADSLYADYH